MALGLFYGLTIIVAVVNGQTSTLPPVTEDSTISASPIETTETGSSGNCTDYAENCESMTNLCTDAIYYDLMTTNCAASCGRCNPVTQAPGTCVDIASNCVKYLSNCQNSNYREALSKNCAQTCGFCFGDGPCRDVSTSCLFWKNNGFCSNDFYTLEYKKTTCGVTCGLC